ncbi:hypothetical protein [Dyella silvae]|uniref:hypothetical protein n=1 Tax=Dyella silvae TaxID=2994424 RepID=UPI002264F02A|nr:hypothetical protein [Dyella silvae]
MDTLILLFYMLLALTGYERGHTVVTHAVVNGENVIDSQVQIDGPMATFRCLRSKSGVCHYTVLPRRCAASGGDCKPPLSSFSMREGKSLLVTDLPTDFASCVTASPAAAGECAQQIASASP